MLCKSHKLSVTDTLKANSKTSSSFIMRLNDLVKYLNDKFPNANIITNDINRRLTLDISILKIKDFSTMKSMLPNYGITLEMQDQDVILLLLNYK